MLGLMITMGIFLVVSIVGSGETLTRGTVKMAEDTNLEDGEFEVFVPLTDSEKEDIRELGADIEEQFYYDYQMKDEAYGTLRIFKIRDRINRIRYIEGGEPAADEVILEKRYAYEHGLEVGDTIEIADRTYRISAIGVTSDYDGPFKEISDTSCNSKLFGTVFFTEQAYEAFRTSGRAQKSETYLYAYTLGENAEGTNDGASDTSVKKDKAAIEADLKEYLKDLKIDSSQVDDEFFAEYWDRTGGIADELTDAVSDLREATEDVRDGLDEMSDNNDDINDATSTIMDAYLEQTSAALQRYIPGIELTEDNYKEKMDELVKMADLTGNPMLKPALEEAKARLDDLKKYKDGVAEYTDAVTELRDGTDEMAEGVTELDTSVNDILDEYDFSLSNLTSFLKRADNPRIFATKNDKIVDIEVGVIAGVILLILMAYVISVFVVHSIESESSIIGTLYSMGVTKNDLLFHYVSLPVVVTFIAGLIGLLIASTGLMAPMIAESSYMYFSIPEFDFMVPEYLLIYSIVCPPLIAVIVNILVINSRLKRTALSLIRNEVKQKNNTRFKFKGMGFVQAFRLRQMLRELRSTLAVILGMLLAMLIFMMSVDCYSLCSNIADDYARDTRYEYMYTLKYPEKEVPEGGEEAYAYTCKKTAFGYSFDVTILGLKEDDSFFDVRPGKSRMDVTVSSALAEKFGLHEGEEFIVTDEEKEIKYAFSVKEIVTYSTGFFIFMDIDEMRDMMGETSDYYNVVFSDKELDIEPGRLYSTTTRDDIVRGAEVFSDLMMPMIYTLSAASVVIFCVVMYLMMKVMIDRSAQNISLIKVFGYNRREIKKLYLDGNFYVIALGALLIIPLSKKIMNVLFPFMVSNVACGLNLSTPLYFYFIIYGVILLLYLFINTILVRRLDHFTPAEILKNRE